MMPQHADTNRIPEPAIGWVQAMERARIDAAVDLVRNNIDRLRHIMGEAEVMPLDTVEDMRAYALNADGELKRIQRKLRQLRKEP